LTSTHPPTPSSSPLSLHDALPIFTLFPHPSTEVIDLRSCVKRLMTRSASRRSNPRVMMTSVTNSTRLSLRRKVPSFALRFIRSRSEEHTSELQSHLNLVCRLLLEK